MTRHYELEKIRYYMYDEKVTPIESGSDLDVLIKKADKIKIHDGKSFEDKIRIAEIVNGDITHYPYIRKARER